MGCPPRVLVSLGFGFTVMNVSLVAVVLVGSWLFCLILVADLSDLCFLSVLCFCSLSCFVFVVFYFVLTLGGCICGIFAVDWFVNP